MKGIADMNSDKNREALLCECDEPHADAITAALKKMPEEETIYELSDFFKILGDSTRVNILLVID